MILLRVSYVISMHKLIIPYLFPLTIFDFTSFASYPMGNWSTFPGSKAAGA